MASDAVPIDVPAHVLANWQAIANLLASMAGVPAALVMRVVGPNIEVFVASETADNPYRVGEHEVLAGSGLYCERVIRSGQMLLVADALADPAWRDNPDVRLNMISYLGFPIRLPDGNPFGTLCVLDRRANTYNDSVAALMKQLRDLIESHLSLLYMNRVLGDERKRLQDYVAEIQALRGIVQMCSSCKRIEDAKGDWQSIEDILMRDSSAEVTHTLCPRCMDKLYPEYNVRV